jgi:hydrophobe/amphiphile efflux-3 (HAE3) family protein
MQTLYWSGSGNIFGVDRYSPQTPLEEYVMEITKALFGPVARLVNHHPKAILAAMVLLAIAALFCATMVPSQESSDQYLDKNSPAGITYDLYNNRYGQDTYILVIQGSDLSDPDLLNDLLVLEKQIRRIDRVGSVVSIADIVAQNHGGTIPGTSAEVTAITNALPDDTRSTYLPDKQMSLAYVVIDQGVSSDTSSMVEPYVVTAIDEATLPPGVSIELTGNTPYNIQLADAMKTAFMTVIIACIVFMLLVLAFLFSNMRYWFLPVILLVFGLFFMFGIMGILQIPGNDGALAAFPILLGLGIDYAVQFQSRFDEERRQSGADEAVYTTITSTGPSVLIALAATALGFAAMYITPIPMIHTFATVSILGISCCYVTTLFGFGAFMHFLRYTPKPLHAGVSGRLMAAYGERVALLAKRIVRFAIPVLIVAVVIAAVGISMDKGILIDMSQQSMVPSDLPAQLVSDKVTSVAGSFTPLPLYIRGIDTTTVNGITWIDRMCTYIQEKNGKIASIDSLPALIRSRNNGVLPTTQADLDRVLATIPPAQIAAYRIDTTTSIVTISTTSMTVNQQCAFVDNLKNDIAWLEPPAGAEITPTGDFTLYTSLTEQVKISKDQMTFLGFILILIFLLLMYRTWVAATPLIPLICVVGWNPLAMIALGQNYNMLTAVLGSMTIGVGSEYTVLVMERYLEEVRATGDHLRSIQEAVRKIGSAVTVSGLVTASGFSALLLAPFPILSSFGLATVFAVLFSLVGAIVIMPAALALISGTSAKKTGPQES